MFVNFLPNIQWDFSSFKETAKGLLKDRRFQIALGVISSLGLLIFFYQQQQRKNLKLSSSSVSENLGHLDIQKKIQQLVKQRLAIKGAPSLEELKSDKANESCEHFTAVKDGCVPCIIRCVRGDLTVVAQKLWSSDLSDFLEANKDDESKETIDINKILSAWEVHEQKKEMRPALEAWIQAFLLSQDNANGHWDDYFGKKGFNVSKFPSLQQRIQQIALEQISR